MPHRLKFGHAMLVFTLIFGGCTKVPETGTPSGLPGSTTNYVYISNTGTGGPGTISAYALDATTGALTALTNSPFSAGTNPSILRAHPSNKFLYVCTDDGMRAFAIDQSNGALSEISGSPFLNGTSCSGVAITPNGDFIYKTDSAADLVYMYSVNETTGALTLVAGSSVATGGVAPYALATDPAGKFLFVSHVNNNVTAAFTINQTTGALTAVAGSPFTSEFGGRDIEVDPTGQFLYVSTEGAWPNGGIDGYSINSTTGVLTPVPGSPFAIDPVNGVSSFAMAIAPSGNYLYASDWTTGDIYIFAINPTTGAIAETAASAFAGGSESWGLTIEPTGKFLFGVDMANNRVKVFPLDTTSGSIGTATSGSPHAVGTSPLEAVTVTITQ